MESAPVVEIDDVVAIKAECDFIERECVIVSTTIDVGIENTLLSIVGVEHSSPQERLAPVLLKIPKMMLM